MNRRSWASGLGIVACSVVVAYHPALAQQTTGSASTTVTQAAASDDLDEIVVHGIRRGDLILPTTVTSDSAYGLDLSVMDTPRNNTVLSKAQLDALNIQNPGGFSYLTSSSYSDASFGQPNIPRIRGQYADLFFNGMRDSFTLNGYGAPISFNSVESIDIVKGPASVQAGAGAGVGGSIDITTKMPSLVKFSAEVDVEFDSQQKRRASLRCGRSALIQYGRARELHAAMTAAATTTTCFFTSSRCLCRCSPNSRPQYTVLFTGGFEDTTYRENDGINRVNQGLIDNGTYLTGGAVAGP